VNAFGGEDPFCMGESPPCTFWHEIITQEAAQKANFSRRAANEIAWHADYVDAYAYNPLWWAEGGLDRLKVSLSSPDLKNVHFDDLTANGQVRAAWQRYLTGTVIGLMWAKDQPNSVSAARNIIGVSLHAVQDFYAHSNWVDAQANRNTTWFEKDPDLRKRISLYTGTYELPNQVGIKPHGKIGYACSVYRLSQVSPVINVACAAVSPISNSEICLEYRECQGGVTFRPIVFGTTIPRNIVYFSPPGIALDTTWTSDIAVQQRNLSGITGSELFETAQSLALKQSIEWLEMLEKTMIQSDARTFWDHVKNDNPTTTKEDEFERYDRRPYQFISSGPYPIASGPPSHEYYLRVRLQTSNDSGAGTDSDIYLHALGKRFLLDHLPRKIPGLAYDDFETGDVQVFTVGPFDRLPTSISIENRSNSVSTTVNTIGRRIPEAIDNFVDESGSFLLSLIGGHSDFVKSNKIIFTSENLSRVTERGSTFSIDLNGGSEGRYQLTGVISKVRETKKDNPAQSWVEYKIKLTSLICMEESDWDRATNSDEPYILTVLIPFPGDNQSHLFGPYSDVDTGETRGFNYSFRTVRIPKEHGNLVLAVSIWESDDESLRERTDNLRKFANEAESRTAGLKQGMLDAIGATIATDWKLQSIEVFAFDRGNTIQYGLVLNQTVNKWIGGRQEMEFILNARKMVTLRIKASELENGAP
jgi:hypothetical protein